MRRFRPNPRLLPALTVAMLCAALTGCAAMTNPVADGVPVRRLPPEVLGRPREEQRVIPLTLLRQPPATRYTLDAGDVLGVWIEGVLGDRNQPPPVQIREGDQPPSLGFPVPVRENGTISLPFIDPLLVKGMTIEQVLVLIRQTYTVKKQILQQGRERILVELQKRRTYHVLVLREDSGGLTIGQGGVIGNTKRGTGFDLHLPAQENDVLNALARTGGFPGLDAKTEVIIERSATGQPPTAQPPQCLADAFASGWGGGQKTRIPLRLWPDEPIPFQPEEVILQNGDIVYIESRDTEVFYTGGLLGSGQFPLPRDIDVDVVEAISLVRGPLISGSINTNQISFTGDTLQTGLGSPSPSLVTIIRRTPGGGQIQIRVDLNRALRDPRERILIQAKDLIILQETMGEAITRYATSIFRLDFLGTILRRRDAIATTAISAP